MTSPTRPTRPRLRPGVLPALLVAVAGASAFLAGSSLPAAGAGVEQGNRPVNAGATDPLDITAHNSSTAVQNPAQPERLVVVNRVDTPVFSCAVHLSADRGTTWFDAELPFPEGEEAPPRCFAPDAAFGPEGTLYVSFVTLAGAGNTPNALWLVSSDDSGQSFSTPVRVAGPLTFQARLATAPDVPGRLYLTWLQGLGVGNLQFSEPGNPIVSAGSDDGGRTWSEPAQVSAPDHARALAPQPAVGSEGELYVLYLDLGDDVLDYHGAHEGQGGEPYDGTWSLHLARSSDRGATWAHSVVDAGVVPIERVIVFFPTAPSLAVDRDSGRVHAGFHDARLGDPDVWVWTSDDGGASFAPPVRVNDTPEGEGTSQYLPQLAVAPGGRLDVVYYDRREDEEDVMNTVSLQSSGDGGETFRPRLALSDAEFDSRIGFGSERDMPDLGSRLGLVATDRRALAVWTDTRAGTQASNKQDLARAVVAFSPASPYRAPLQVAGVVLAGAGIVILLWSVWPGGGGGGDGADTPMRQPPTCWWARRRPAPAPAGARSGPGPAPEPRSGAGQTEG